MKKETTTVESYKLQLKNVKLSSQPTHTNFSAEVEVDGNRIGSVNYHRGNFDTQEIMTLQRYYNNSSDVSKFPYLEDNLKRLCSDMVVKLELLIKDSDTVTCS